MSADFVSFIGPQAGDPATRETAVAEARACIERFSAAFNREDIAAMDRELRFPHVMLSSERRLEWPAPGQHPADLFDALRRGGWAESVHLSIEPLLVAADKVDFKVIYERRGQDGRAISRHENVWIVVRERGRWGIALRSY